ncbi:hypothetical protein [Paludisphaera soli]|uniref:hypothetical protein n=1 Tax=Paludisphaera soli TaxID=2712865 RepID=UPI0013EC754C|nr:hypothetical protein [Paludisphaera soli]
MGRSTARLRGRESELAAWAVLGRRLERERKREDWSDFAGRLDAAIEAELTDVGPPVDGGWLASATETIVVEPASAWAPEALIGGRSTNAAYAVEFLERGVERLGREGGIEGRITLAHGLAFAAAARRQEGDLPRAVQLCAISRAGLEALAPSIPERLVAARLHALTWAWAQTTKACWQGGDIVGTSEALGPTIDAAQALVAFAPHDLGGRRGLDGALARLSRFACERGDFRKSEEALERRRPLWESGSVEAFNLAEDFRKLAEAKKEHEARDADSPAR